jgi:hypothetical protein
VARQFLVFFSVIRRRTSFKRYSTQIHPSDPATVLCVLDESRMGIMSLSRNEAIRLLIIAPFAALPFTLPVFTISDETCNAAV